MSKRGCADKPLSHRYRNSVMDAERTGINYLMGSPTHVPTFAAAKATGGGGGGGGRPGSGGVGRTPGVNGSYVSHVSAPKSPELTTAAYSSSKIGRGGGRAARAPAVSWADVPDNGARRASADGNNTGAETLQGHYRPAPHFYPGPSPNKVSLGPLSPGAADLDEEYITFM